MLLFVDESNQTQKLQLAEKNEKKMRNDCWGKAQNLLQNNGNIFLLGLISILGTFS